MKLDSLLKKKPLSESECVHLLTLIRHELEASETESNYDYIKFFCDWSLHKKIDRSMAGSNAIVSINKVLSDERKSDTDVLIKEMSAQFIGKFKDQMKDFLNKNSRPSDIIDNDNQWKEFLKMMLEIISQKPVILNKNKHEKKVSGNPLKEGMWATEISIEKVDLSSKQQDINSASSKAIYCLKVLTSDSTKIIIPITP
jgi:hypothetical protein